MLDVEPESDEDEDTIIERRRQLHQAIVNKYHQPGPTTPQASSPTTPPSEVNLETAIRERIEEVLEEEKEEEEGRQEGVEWRVRRGPPRVSSRRTQEKRSKCKRNSDESCRLLFVMGTCSVRKTSSQMVSEMGVGGGGGGGVEDINRV